MDVDVIVVIVVAAICVALVAGVHYFERRELD